MTEQELGVWAKQAAVSLEALPEHTAHYQLAAAVQALVAEVGRFQALLQQAEWSAGYEATAYEPEPSGACPWCAGLRPGELSGHAGGHEPTCPAFPLQP